MIKCLSRNGSLAWGVVQTGEVIIITVIVWSGAVIGLCLWMFMYLAVHLLLRHCFTEFLESRIRLGEVGRRGCGIGSRYLVAEQCDIVSRLIRLLFLENRLIESIESSLPTQIFPLSHDMKTADASILTPPCPDNVS
jgi:hypothetical protein